jgi:membrane dipeptidase
LRISEAPLLVFDGHNDTLLNLHLPGRGKGRSFFERSDAGHVDLPRALEGGFGGGFFACYVPTPKDGGLTDEPALAINKSGHAGAPPLDSAYARDFAAELGKDCFGSRSNPKDG